MVKLLCFLIVTFCSLVVSTAAVSEISNTRESEIYLSFRPSVFAIFGEFGYGSGFLIDSCGLVLTDRMVVSNSKDVRVQIDDTTVVPAYLVAEDTVMQIAAILINPAAAHGLPLLQLATDSQPYANEGDRVLIIGNPLNQLRTLSTGIVSRIESKFLLCDAEVSPSASGSPLISYSGEVIGLTNSVGISSRGYNEACRCIRLDQCTQFIDSVKEMASTIVPPIFKKFPCMPREPYPMRILNESLANQDFPISAYRISKDGYNIEILSPPFNYWRALQAQVNSSTLATVMGRHSLSDYGGGAMMEENLSPWFQYLGWCAPVIVINIVPRVGESSGSKVGKILGGVMAGAIGAPFQRIHDMAFEADLEQMLFLSNGQPVDDIRHGMCYLPLNYLRVTLGEEYSGEGIAKAGVYMYRPEAFDPIGKKWPDLKLVITNSKQPDKPDSIKIPIETIARIWQDFMPYRSYMKPDSNRTN